MLTKKGFTMIETLFVLFIITILSSLTMTFHLPQKKDATYIQEISYIFNQAKLNAMVYKEKTTVSVQKQRITITSSHYKKDYLLEKPVSLEKYLFTYNALGHIKTAKTIHFYGRDKTYAFVFQVGSGSFYVQ